LENIQS
jgi:hypothetical protein